MQDILALFIILLVSYFVYSYLFDSKEHYVTSIVGYNNISIPVYNVPSLFDLETRELVKVFKTAFNDDNVEPIEYKAHNPYVPFPFEAPIKKLIIDYMKTNIDKFKGQKWEIS